MTVYCAACNAFSTQIDPDLEPHHDLHLVSEEDEFDEYRCRVCQTVWHHDHADKEWSSL